MPTPRLVTYKVTPMPMSEARKLNAYASSKYSEEVRQMAEELRTIYQADSLHVPDQFSYVEFYRDAKPGEDCKDDVVTVAKRLVSESAVVDGFGMVKELNDIPEGAEWAIIADWQSAVLTVLYFAID